ncbi:MAG: hypothetical protein K8I82_00710, partial [Anaerolineae bacterium]|nr:hypothetical protein [Anaerolineae bacterium]
KAGLSQACLKCHPGSENRDHPIGVTPRKAEGLPLDEESRITCITCHEPHGKETFGQLLRKDFNSLCRSCHKT